MLLTSYDLNFQLAVSTTIILGLAAISMCRFERRCREAQKFWSSPTGTALSEDGSTAESLSDELQTLQQTVRELQDVLNGLQQAPDASAAEKDRPLPLENAMRMARNGASTDELTKSCGLNIGEAHLLRKLHAGQRSGNVRAH